MFEEIEDGVELFNDLDFFAAHDFFEALWINADSKDRLFYQGMVQISVGGYHLLNKNFKGALSQYKKGTNKLKNYVPKYKGIELKELLEKIDEIKSDLEFYFLDNNFKLNIDNLPKIKRI